MHTHTEMHKHNHMSHTHTFTRTHTHTHIHLHMHACMRTQCLNSIYTIQTKLSLNTKIDEGTQDFKMIIVA